MLCEKYEYVKIISQNLNIIGLLVEKFVVVFFFILLGIQIELYSHHAKTRIKLPHSGFKKYLHDKVSTHGRGTARI